MPSFFKLLLVFRVVTMFSLSEYPSGYTTSYIFLFFFSLFLKSSSNFFFVLILKSLFFLIFFTCCNCQHLVSSLTSLPSLIHFRECSLNNSLWYFLFFCILIDFVFFSLYFLLILLFILSLCVLSIRYSIFFCF